MGRGGARVAAVVYAALVCACDAGITLEFGSALLMNLSMRNSGGKKLEQIPGVLLVLFTTMTLMAAVEEQFASAVGSCRNHLSREARAELTNVEDRIAAAGSPRAARESSPG